MTKNKKQITSRMLKDLGLEHMEFGGFNEFSQFAEERLASIIDLLNNKQLDWLIYEIESVSRLGIDRKEYKNSKLE